MGRPPAKNARDTRQAILEAALNLFAEKGFFGTGMREIARAVGVRESAIYHHFTNKEALLESLMVESGEEKALAFERNLERWGTLPTRQLLMNLAEAMVEAWDAPRERKLWRIQTTEGFRLAESGKFQMDAAFRKAGARMTQLFRELAEAKRIKPISPELLGLEFMTPMFLVRNMTSSPKAFPLPPGITPKTVLAAHVSFFCDAIGA